MLDRNSAAELTARHPHLFHIMYRATAETHESVTEHGLTIGAPSRHFWHALDKPRPGHLYLATSTYLTKVRNWGCRDSAVDIYAVSSGALVPARLNPDEDCFRLGDSWGDCLKEDTLTAANHPCRIFHLPFPATYWHWRWAEHLGIHQVPSHGEWADAVSLGSDPRHTAYSINHGSAAYCGDIPPSALQHIFTTRSDAC